MLFTVVRLNDEQIGQEQVQALRLSEACRRWR